jgi:catechol 2,3-dioxygenase-like lactoylglutathione lyase family enzyme
MMRNTLVVVSLPIADRRTSFAFYRDGLGFAAVGEPWEDGIPEPLQFALNDGVRVMLIPTGGFDRITGDHQVAPAESVSASWSSRPAPTKAWTRPSSVPKLLVPTSSPRPGSSHGATRVPSPIPTGTSGWSGRRARRGRLRKPTRSL